MSGLVRTYSPWSRVQSRCSRGLSPSWVVTRTSSAEREQAGQLVLGQRLRGREVEHGRRRVRRGRRGRCWIAVERGQLVGERLPGGGAGGEHDVLAGVGGLGGAAWCRHGALDPARGVRRPELVGHPARPVGDDGLPGGQHLEVGEPVLPPGHARQAVDEALHGKAVGAQVVLFTA